MRSPSLYHSVRQNHDDSLPSSQEVERHLVRQAQKGDERAKEALLSAYREPLSRYFGRTLTSVDEVEDLTSDTLLAVSQSIAKFRGLNLYAEPLIGRTSRPDSAASKPCSFKTYVYAIAANHLKMWLRRKTGSAHRKAVLTSALTDDSTAGLNVNYGSALHSSGTDPLMQLLDRERRDSAYYALADVGCRSMEQYKALVLHYACGLQHQDVATVLSTRKETVNTRLQEGRSALRSSMKRSFEAQLAAV